MSDSAGAYMTFREAFKKTVAVEGVREIAERTFADAVMSGRVEAFAVRRDHVFLPNEDERTPRFALGSQFWEHFCLVRGDDGFPGLDCTDMDRLPDDPGDPVFIVDGAVFELDDWEFVVRTESLDRLFSDDLPSNKSNSPNGKGGRPSTLDWPGAAAFAAAFVAESDYPDTQADLVAAVQTWFKTEGKVPDKRSIERFVSVMYDTGEQMKSGRRKT